MDAETKVAKQRLSVLNWAARLGNAAEACRRRGIDRSSFYEWKRRFQTQGFDGLKDLPPIHRSHPQCTSAEVLERILTLALQHPAYGCNRIEALLMLEGTRVSAITIQKILNDHELGLRESSSHSAPMVLRVSEVDVPAAALFGSSRLATAAVRCALRTCAAAIAPVSHPGARRDSLRRQNESRGAIRRAERLPA
jgi:transposase